MPIILTPASLYTAQDIIKAAFRVIGVTSKGETPSADEMQDAFQALNIMIDAWSARKLLGQALIQENFPLTASKQSYTIGPGGDFNTSKPFDITSGYYQDSQSIKYPLSIVTRELFDSYLESQIVSAMPEALFYDPGETQQANQLGTIYLYFTPDATSTYTLYINSQKPFTEFSNLTDQVTFPAAYYRALKFNLAVEIAPEYGRPVPQEVVHAAIESLEDLEAVNAKQLVAAVDIPGRRGNTYNYVSDTTN